MGATVDMASCVAKFNQFFNTASGERKINEALKNYVIGVGVLPGGLHTPEEAANKFIEVLGKTIDSSGLSAEAIESVKHWDYGRAQQIYGNIYEVIVYEAADMSRPTMSKKDGPIKDIVELLNYGVDHQMKRVWGTWQGKHIGSRTVIPGAHFLEQAKNDFLGNYGTEYGVIDIQIITQ